MSEEMLLPSFEELAEQELEAFRQKIHTNVMKYTIKLMIEDNKRGAQLYAKVMEPANKAILQCVMLISEGNQSKAARILGISRGTIREYLFRYFGRLDIGVRSHSAKDTKISKNTKAEEKKEQHL